MHAKPTSILDVVRGLERPSEPAPPAAPVVLPRRFVMHEPNPPSNNAPPSRPHLPDAAPATPAGPGDAVRLAIVQADFNRDLTDRMADAALRHAAELNCPVVAHIHVPGVFESPLAARMLCDRADVDAVVVLACVIQGETSHDEVITHAAAQALAELSVAARKPVAFGVTGPRMTRAQAEARVVVGENAVDAAVKQHRILKALRA